jgi:5'-phosphate synthase pdxT subunit
MNKTIGVLALQGGFASHIAVLESLGATTREVRTRDDLASCDSLVIPGGESTVLTRLLMEPGTGYGTGRPWIPTTLFHAISDFVRERPTMGTCAGLIMLARPCGDERVVSLNALDVDVARNAYGRQTESFVEPVTLSFNEGQAATAEGVNPREANTSRYPATFIRAPKITRVGTGIAILASVPRPDGGSDPVFVRQGNLLGLTFHPELTPKDTRIHEYFMSL